MRFEDCKKDKFYKVTFLKSNISFVFRCELINLETDVIEGFDLWDNTDENVGKWIADISDFEQDPYSLREITDYTHPEYFL